MCWYAMQVSIIVRICWCYMKNIFENRLNRLHYSIVNGKMHFSSDLQQMPIEELLRLRSMPNGRMDLLTVDESVRLNANMMVQFDGILDDLLNNQ